MWCVYFFFSLIVCSFAANEDNLSEEFCRQFPSLHLCRLHDNLQGSLVELQYLLQDSNIEIGNPWVEAIVILGVSGIIAALYVWKMIQSPIPTAGRI
ncbi:hypothetical protein ANCCEY_10287 [Ancylostoma ceylanicum]|uniref:Uncharacterized protein n=1 Tax=Ancylostoma ceylanicum TaxID=53326 RepID=A0A0D6LSI9_9BILA|nr:hypothetical protein ANCCEY_10287 [Ancylostoma ceylanicum]